MPAQIEILLVEDNPGDVRLAQETLKDYNIQNTVRVIQDGADAIAYLRGDGKFADCRRPDLLILDLSLPKIDGPEILAEIRRDKALCCLPVVLLTVSDTDREMWGAYGVHPDCVITKPLTVDKYLEALRCFPQFGLSIVRVAEAGR